MNQANKWENDWEYWLVALGTAVGFGCIWRFPYIVYNNGGAVFLIPYYIFMFGFGIPQQFLETTVGQYFRESLIDTYSKVSWKYLGVAVTSMLVSGVMSIYYIYIMAYCLIYLVAGFGTLPWMYGEEKDILEHTRKFYMEKVVQLNPNKDELGGWNWPLVLSVLVCWIIVFLCIRKGTEQTGKIALITVCMPYVLLVIFLIRVSMLDGFSNGIVYLLKPDFSKLFTLQIWKDALIQVFFQLSLGQGCMITFASFRDVKEKIVLPTRLIPLINSFTGLLASFIIFGYLGYFCQKYDHDINSLQIAGPGLIFITFPACLSTMGMPHLFMFLFFVTMVLLGIDTQFALVETVCYMVEDVSMKIRKRELDPQLVRGGICLVTFFIGLPIATQGGPYLIDLLDTFGYSIPASVTNLLEIYIWVKITDFDKGVKKLMAVTEEEIPKQDMYCLDYSSFWVMCVMLAVCVYLTFRDGIFGEKFTAGFSLAGIIILALMLLPPIYYFILHSDEPVHTDPYSGTLDTHHRHRLLSYEEVGSDYNDSPSMSSNKKALKELNILA